MKVAMSDLLRIKKCTTCHTMPMFGYKKMGGVEYFKLICVECNHYATFLDINTAIDRWNELFGERDHVSDK